MREILFRGKRFMDGAFVDGSLFIDEKKDKHEILVGYVNYRVGWEVDPETVGQFTGLTDKNGKKIFEGDIIRYAHGEEPASFIGVVKCGEFSPDGLGEHYATNVGFYVKWIDQYGKHVLLRKDIGFWTKFREIEVIGNIHDNPELLEE